MFFDDRHFHMRQNRGGLAGVEGMEERTLQFGIGCLDLRPKLDLGGAEAVGGKHFDVHAGAPCNFIRRSRLAVRTIAPATAPASVANAAPRAPIGPIAARATPSVTSSMTESAARWACGCSMAHRPLPATDSQGVDKDRQGRKGKNAAAAGVLASIDQHHQPIARCHEDQAKSAGDRSEDNAGKQQHAAQLGNAARGKSPGGLGREPIAHADQEHLRDAHQTQASGQGAHFSLGMPRGQDPGADVRRQRGGQQVRPGPSGPATSFAANRSRCGRSEKSTICVRRRTSRPGPRR